MSATVVCMPDTMPSLSLRPTAFCLTISINLNSSMKVFKFGGASVNSVERIKKLPDILQLYPNEKILIVISAMCRDWVKTIIMVRGSTKAE